MHERHGVHVRGSVLARQAAHPAALGSAWIQHGVRKRREITGINRVNRTRERAASLVGLAARFTRDKPEKPQVSALISPLEQLPRHHHPLDLVRPLINLGDLGVVGVAHHPLDRVVVHLAVAAEELDGRRW
jgi:hypothetical protein